MLAAPPPAPKPLEACNSVAHNYTQRKAGFLVRTHDDIFSHALVDSIQAAMDLENNVRSTNTTRKLTELTVVRAEQK